MDRHPSPQSTLYTPFQTRAAQFLRNFGLRSRARAGKKKSSPVNITNPVDDRPRAHSVDILRKPTVLSTIVGYRDDTSNPTDIDDSPQDAPSCDNTLPRQFRRRSTSDHPARSASHSSPSATYPQSFVGDQTIPEVIVEELCNADATPSFLPNASAGAIMRSASETYSGLGPSLPLQQDPGPGQSTTTDQTPRPTPIATSNDTITPAPPVAPSVEFPPYEASLNTLSSPPEDTVQKAKVPLGSIQGLHSSSLPVPFRVVTEYGIRPSPVIASRPPLTVLGLPPLAPSMPAISTPSRQQSHLRSVPSLSVHGHSSADREANHDTASLGGSEGEESDESDEMELVDLPDAHQSDEDDEESPRAGPSTIHRVATLQTNLDANCALSTGAGPSSAGPSPSASCYVPPISIEHLGSRAYTKSVEFSPQSPPTSWRFSPKIPRVEGVDMSNVQDNASAVAGPSGKAGSLSELRPSLYRIASRSMIDFGTSSRGDCDHVGALSDAPSTPGQTTETTESSDVEALVRRFRRNSIPNYQHPTSDPPPYPSFIPRPKASREDAFASMQSVEGGTRERLPPYSNSLYLAAVMPRKMEFIAPGVQAKDRKWRRVLCELEGTVFRVYKCPPGASGAGILGDWWERQVGVGDVAVVANHTQPQVSAVRSGDESREVKEGLERLQAPPLASGGGAATRERTGSQSSRHGEGPEPSSRTARRASGASFLSSFRSSVNAVRSGRGPSSEPSTPNRLESRIATTELSPGDPRDGHAMLLSESNEANNRSAGSPALTSVALSPPCSATFPPERPQHRGGIVEVPNPAKCDLIRAYTLQNAESGLGNDYIKRKHVIRLRLEGEQFLLQAPDVPSVVEWIEGLHAGTNIALDLDQRTMPRGPIFPRRRRRRNRRVEEAPAMRMGFP